MHEIVGPKACVICGNKPLIAYLLPDHPVMTLREYTIFRAIADEEEEEVDADEVSL